MNFVYCPSLKAFELAVGSLDGDLLIFKGEETIPIASASGLGTVNIFTAHADCWRLVSCTVFALFNVYSSCIVASTLTVLLALYCTVAKKTKYQIQLSLETNWWHIVCSPASMDTLDQLENLHC